MRDMLIARPLHAFVGLRRELAMLTVNRAKSVCTGADEVCSFRRVNLEEPFFISHYFSFEVLACDKDSSSVDSCIVWVSYHSRV